MAAYGQTFDSNAWLQRNRGAQLVYPRIEAGARTSVGDQVWVAWWLTPWVFVVPPQFDQGRLLRSTWLSNPLTSYPRVWPLLQRQSSQVGATVWNNWFFNTAYTAPNKLAVFAGVGPYSYVGKAANLGALHRYSLVLAGAGYTYTGAGSHSDYGIDSDVIPYITDGGDIVSPPDQMLVVATAIGYAPDFDTGVMTLRSPGDVFYIHRSQFTDSAVDYLAGVPGGPFFGWMKVAPPGAVPTNPSDGGVPVYDYQPPPRRLVF
jgi:hypothetical protein